MAPAKKAKEPERDTMQDQFPSEHGDDELEVARRSADTTEERTDTHTKVFVVPPGTDVTDEVHERNIWAMRQYLINQGLRPEEDGRFVGQDENEDGVSIDLAYECSVQPAHVATDPEVKNATVATEGKTSTED
jgi:hypothetical protein